MAGSLHPTPLVLRVPEKIHSPRRTGNVLSATRSTFRAIREQPELWWFLIAYLLYLDGVNTVISIASNYAKTLGYQTGAILETLILVQLVGVPSTLLITWLGQRYGPRPFLFAGMALYFVVVGYGAAMPSHSFSVAGLAINPLFLLGTLVGIGQGGIQSLSRSYFLSLVPEERPASYFGFYNMLGQYASLLGPLLVGGGIGGMALALSLHDAGVGEVTVYESSSALSELGVGINAFPTPRVN